ARWAPLGLTGHGSDRGARQPQLRSERLGIVHVEWQRDGLSPQLSDLPNDRLGLLATCAISQDGRADILATGLDLARVGPPHLRTNCNCVSRLRSDRPPRTSRSA